MAVSWAQRMLRVWRVLPPRMNFGAASTTSTEAPPRRAAIAAHSAALPPPTTSTSYFLERSAISGSIWQKPRALEIPRNWTSRCGILHTTNAEPARFLTRCSCLPSMRRTAFTGALMSDAGRKYRIWAQGGTDRDRPRQLPGQAAALHPVLPGLGLRARLPDHHAVGDDHARAFEFRFARAAIRGAFEAKKQGYDAYFMNHFSGCGTLRGAAAVDIPVMGLGEATLLHACTLGRRLGLVAINPAFVPWHRGSGVALRPAAARGRRTHHRRAHQRLHDGLRR